MRESLDTYFMNIAKLVAERSTCNRKKVGTVLVKDKRIIGTGYNGSLSGDFHCEEIGCDLHNDPVHGETCVRTIHSERNAINFAAKYGVSTNGCIAYITCFPCYRCLQDLISAGISSIIYEEKYVDVQNIEIANKSNLSILQYNKQYDYP